MKAVLNNNLTALILVCVVLSLGTARNASGDVLADANLVAYWQFSGDAKDSSGYDNDGTLVGDAIAYEDTLWLPGSADYVNCGDDSSLSFDHTADYTWAGWVYFYRSLTRDNPAPIINLLGDTCGYAIQIDVNDRLQIESYDYGTITAHSTLNDHEWIHIAVVYSNQAVIFYINGQSDGSGSETFDTQTPTYFDVMIGRDGGKYFTGRIDELMVYNVSLEDWEVRKLYNKDHHNYAHFDVVAISGFRGQERTGYCLW